MRVHQDLTWLLATVRRLWRRGKLSTAQYVRLSQCVVSYAARH